jgi:exopolysaccharide biosynthesis polyprenyl glycosylphosphotransferase
MASNDARVRSGVRVVDVRPVYEQPVLQPIQRRRWRVLTAATASMDLLSIVLALAVTSALIPAAFDERSSVAWEVTRILPWWIGLAAVGLYDMRRLGNPIEELRRILYGVSLGWTIAVAAVFWTSTSVPRSWAFTSWVLVLAAVGGGRRVMRKIVHALRGRGRLRRRALIVGADRSGMALAEDVERAAWEGLDVIGFVSAAGENGEAASRASVPIVGDTEDLRELAVSLAVSDVLVAPTVTGNGGLSKIVSELDGVPVELRVAPGLDGYLTSRLSVQPLGDRALVAIERVELKPVARVAKRCVDVALGSALLLISAPIIVVAAVSVRIESGAPAFFSQPRVGLRGRLFRIWKLRTMRPEAEVERSRLDEHNEADGVIFKIRHDPRVTKVGRFLRRTSIDELPQLFNVVLGDMSLVGPRPPLAAEVERYDATLGRRLLVRPGITGLWQVSGRNELSFGDYIRFDLQYVQNWSIALDLYILLKTIPAVVSGKGAY